MKRLKRGWHRCGIPATAWICAACQCLNGSGGQLPDRQCELCGPRVGLPERLARARRRAGLTVGQAERLLEGLLDRRRLEEAETRDAAAGGLQREELIALADLYDLPAAVFGVTDG